MRQQSRRDWLVLGVIIACYLIWSAGFIYKASFVALDGKRYFGLFDDALVSMRYAWNLAHGNGLVWNPGQRVEGYSNLLMVLFMAAPSAVLNQRIAAFCVQLFGVLTVLAVAWLGALLCGRLYIQNESRDVRFQETTVFACLLFYYPVSFWALMGMETGLLTFLILLSVYVCLQDPLRKIHAVAVAVLLGLAYLTRPDSLVCAVLIFLLLYLKNRRWILHSGLVYLLFPAGQFLFRLAYYSELWPNTYVLKLTGMSLSSRLQNGIAFITPFLISHFVLWIGALAATIRSRDPVRFSLFGVAASLVVYQIYVGGDAFPNWRFVTPAIPFLLALLMTGPLFGGRRAPVLMVTLLGMLVATFPFRRQFSLIEAPFTTRFNLANVNLSIVLDEVTAPDATVGVLWAGALPYYSGRTSIDFLGKSDPVIAALPPDQSGMIKMGRMTSLPGHNKYDLRYSIEKLQPTYIQTLAWGTQNLETWAACCYVVAEYRGVPLLLRKESPSVYWEKLTAIRALR